MTADELARFMAKVEVVESGCWLWLASGNRKGYGKFCFRGRKPHAHRVAYEHFVGPIPAGLQIDHLCSVKNCVNPEHLEPVTARENSRRKPQSPTCPRGHAFTVANTGFDKRGRRHCIECRQTSWQRYLAWRRAH